MLLGYARVSSEEQDTALQVAAFRTAGVVAYFEERRSSVKARPELERCVSLLNPGDVLVVYKLDRLARSVVHLLSLIQRVEAAGASLRSLTEPIETVTPAGRMIVQLLGVFAEFERAVIVERCNAGRRAAKARGVRFGRTRQFDYGEALRLREQGATFDAIARHLGVSQAAVVSALRRVRSGLTGVSGALG